MSLFLEIPPRPFDMLESIAYNLKLVISTGCYTSYMIDLGFSSNALIAVIQRTNLLAVFLHYTINKAGTINNETPA